MQIIEEYQQVREVYQNIHDTDASQAYALMVKANTLRSYFDAEFVEADKELTLNKNNIDIVKSRLSIAGDPKNSTNGNRKAMAADDYAIAIEDYAKQKSYVQLLERQIDFLKNVAFQMYTVWDNCKKNGERY